MAQVVLKPIVCDYVQYVRDLDTLDEVMEFFLEDERPIFCYDFEADEYYIDVEGNDPFYVREGQYIVRMFNDYAIYDSEVFEELFDVIEED